MTSPQKTVTSRRQELT